MYCKNCGTQIPERASFCGNCGTKVDSPATSPQAPSKNISSNTKNHKNNNKKPPRGLRIALLLIIVCAASFSVTIGVMLAFQKKSGNASAKEYDEENVGEIYFQAVTEDHIGQSEQIMFSDNEIMLVSKDNVSFKSIEKLAKSYEAEIVGYIEQTGDYQLEFDKSYSMEELEEIASNLKKEDNVLSADLNYIAICNDQTVSSRNGFFYGSEWEDDLQNFNDVKGLSWGAEAINIIGSWDLVDAYQENPVKIGLVDDGFDTSHEDLENCYKEVFYNNSARAHGTHVSGIMAADSYNAEGICGIYPHGEGNLYGVSLQGASDMANLFISSAFLKVAYAQLVLRNVKVINTSLGFNYYQWKDDNDVPVISYGDDEWNKQVVFLEQRANILGDFLNRLLEHGYDFVIVQAAGNDSDRANGVIYDAKYNFWTTVISEADFPEVYRRIIVVGAVTQSMQIANYSNGNSRVDIYAPGGNNSVGIFSTFYEEETQTSGYTSECGTSMAAPHVAGVCASAWTVNNNLTGAQIKESICERGSSRCTSCKMLDAYASLEHAVRLKGVKTEESKGQGSIQFFLVDQTNEMVPVQNAEIKATNVETGEVFDVSAGNKILSDRDGHVELILPVGSYTISITAPGYHAYEYESSLTVEKDKITEPGEKGKIMIKSLLQTYLEETIIPTYGAFPKSQSGSMMEVQDQWFNNTGVLGATIYNYDQDEMNELLVCIAEDVEDDSNISYSILNLYMYEVEDDQIVEKASVSARAYREEYYSDYSGMCCLMKNEFAALSLGISLVSVYHQNLPSEHDIYILCEDMSTTAAFADGSSSNFFGYIYNGSSFQYAMSYTQVAGGSSGFQFRGYVFDEGGNLTDSQLYYSEEAGSSETPLFTNNSEGLSSFFDLFDVKTLALEYDTLARRNLYSENDEFVQSFYMKNYRTNSYARGQAASFANTVENTLE